MGDMIGSPWIAKYQGKRGNTYTVWWRHEQDPRTGRTRSHIGPFPTKAEAERKVKQLLGQSAEGRSLSGVRWKTTVGEYIRGSFFPLFVDNQEENTRVNRASIINTHILPFWDDIRFEWIDNEMVLNFVAHIEAKGKAWATNRKILDIFALIMRRAHLAGGYLPNGLPFDAGVAPLSSVGTNTLHDEATIIFGFDELVQFLDFARKKLSPHHYNLVYTLSYTGMRPGEALDLSPAHLSLAATPPRLRAVASKVRQQGKGKTRDIELDPQLVAVLQDQLTRGNAQWLWPSKKSPTKAHLNDDAFRKRVWAPLVSSFGRPEMSLYGLRHTHASHLLLAGVDQFIVAKRLGHSIKTLERTYAHLLGGEQINALAALRDRQTPGGADAVILPLRSSGSDR